MVHLHTFTCFLNQAICICLHYYFININLLYHQIYIQEWLGYSLLLLWLRLYQYLEHFRALFRVGRLVFNLYYTHMLIFLSLGMS